MYIITKCQSDEGYRRCPYRNRGPSMTRRLLAQTFVQSTVCCGEWGSVVELSLSVKA